MSVSETSESTIPLFPCKSLQETLDFYQTLGFEVTYQQDDPYLYASVRRGSVELHFSKLATWHTRNSVCLIFVTDVALYHSTFADALREKYGRIPTADLPRITRLRPGQTRFHIFDPNGNILLYIDREEPEGEYRWDGQVQSSLSAALENAIFLRDTYVNDKAAAQVLDKALAVRETAVSIDRARALAARAEIAVAMGDAERAQTARAELQQIALSDAERAQFHNELQAADELERWLTG